MFIPRTATVVLRPRFDVAVCRRSCGQVVWHGGRVLMRRMSSANLRLERFVLSRRV